MRQLICFLLAFILMISLAGCSAERQDSITLVIPIRVDRFSTQATLHVQVWNAAQIATDEANPICLIYGNGSGILSTQCPLGKEYMIVTPEEFTFQSGEIGDQIQVVSNRLQRGEDFRISVFGLSADDCNSRSTLYSGVVNKGKIFLEDLIWSQTEMACLKKK
jgi:hypothetical protein